MDIFGKSAKASPFQSELTAKMKERKSLGLGADLTETEDEDDALDDDDDLLAAYSMSSKKPQPRSQSPWGAGSEGRTTPKAEPPKPQSRNLSGATDPRQKQKIPIKPKNELDRLLADDDEDKNLMQTQKKPWQPPQFKDFSHKQEPKPQPRSTKQQQSPFMKSAQRGSLLEEDENENSDDELTGAYKRQMQQERQSPIGRKTPERQSPLTQDRRDSMGRTTPKSKEDELFGGKPSAKKSSGNLDDIFGKRKSPSDQDLFGGRKTPTNTGSESGRKTPTNNAKQVPKADPFGRKTPTQNDDIPGRKTPTQSDDPFARKPSDPFAKKTSTDPIARKSPTDPFARKTPTNQSGPSMDDIFGGKKRAESPLFKSKQKQQDAEDDELRPQRPQSGHRKGSYMSSLLADSDEEQNDREVKPKTRTSYMDSLLGDESTKQKPKPETRTAYMDSLLDDKSEGERKPRPRLRAPPKDNTDGEERDSSIARDVDKDPMMIAQQKKEREAKLEARKGKPQTDSQQAEFDIDEVADAQNSLSMTFIRSEQSASKTQSTPVKPKARRPPGSSPSSTSSTPDNTMRFEGTNDIRNYIYQEWQQKKMATAKQGLSAKKRLEKEIQLKKDKEALDKKLENEATFRSWKERKDEMLKEKIRQKKKEEKKVGDKEKDELEKKRDAEKTFAKWKENKDEVIVDKKRKEKRQEYDKVAEKKEEEERKKKDAEGAFAGWKKKKDRVIKQSVKETRQIERLHVTQKMTDTRRKEIEAEQLYEKWLIRKEEQKRREKLQARSRKSLSDSPRPAWSPANKTIPHGR